MQESPTMPSAISQLNRGYIIIALIAGCLGRVGVAQAQIGKSTDLYLTLKEKDSLLFQVGFNNCDISQFEQLTHEDFEFYHDQGGINDSQSSFINSIENGLCRTGVNSTQRELDEASLEVFPLYSSGTLYGAVQQGIHHFQNTTAKFTHLWLLSDQEWKLARVLSYDHQSQPNE